MREERINEIRRRLAELELQPSRFADEINALRDELLALQATQPHNAEASEQSEQERPRYKTHLEFDVPSAATKSPEPYDWGEASNTVSPSSDCGSVRCLPDYDNPIDEERQSQLDELNKLLEENKGMSLSEAIKKAQALHKKIIPNNA